MGDVLAHYRCLACAHEWHVEPHPVGCPACQHLYVKWINYREGVRWKRWAGK